MGLENIRSMLVAVVSFAEGAVRRNLKKEELPVVSYSWYRLCDSRK